MTFHTYTINMGISVCEFIVGIESEHDPSFELRSQNLTLPQINCVTPKEGAIP
jgi:hypothetical protein